MKVGIAGAILHIMGKLSNGRMRKECKLQEHLKYTNPDWLVSHDCKLNYKRCAGGVEITVAKRYFGHSVKIYLPSQIKEVEKL